MCFEKKNALKLTIQFKLCDMLSDECIDQIMVEKTEAHAISLLGVLKQQATEGDSDSQLALGRLFIKGAHHVPIDDEVSLLWLKKASACGRAAARRLISQVLRECCE